MWPGFKKALLKRRFIIGECELPFGTVCARCNYKSENKIDSGLEFCIVPFR